MSSLTRKKACRSSIIHPSVAARKNSSSLSWRPRRSCVESITDSPRLHLPPSVLWFNDYKRCVVSQQAKAGFGHGDQLPVQTNRAVVWADCTFHNAASGLPRVSGRPSRTPSKSPASLGQNFKEYTERSIPVQFTLPLADEVGRELKQTVCKAGELKVDQRGLNGSISENRTIHKHAPENAHRVRWVQWAGAAAAGPPSFSPLYFSELRSAALDSPSSSCMRLENLFTFASLLCFTHTSIVSRISRY